MKKCFVYSLLIGMFLYLGVGELSAQQVKLERSVIGAGGVVESSNSSNMKMSGIVGQFAIEKVAGTYNGRDLDVWQGFWVPTGITTDVETPGETADDHQLLNYPNPVSYYTTIRYNLPGTAKVTLKVYNVSGNLIKVLVDEIQESGMQEVQWDVKDQMGENVASGSYLYELSVSPAQMAGFGSFQPYSLRKVMVVVK
jgi:hypothetical protein